MYHGGFLYSRRSILLVRCLGRCLGTWILCKVTKKTKSMDSRKNPWNLPTTRCMLVQHGVKGLCYNYDQTIEYITHLFSCFLVELRGLYQLTCCLNLPHSPQFVEGLNKQNEAVHIMTHSSFKINACVQHIPKCIDTARSIILSSHLIWHFI